MRYYYLLLIAVCGLFFSCEKEEGNTIVKTWRIESVSRVLSETIDSAVTANIVLNECTRKERIVFTDKVYTSYSYELQGDGTCSESIVAIPYTFSDRKLTFSIGGKTYTYDVVLFSDTLILKGENSEGEKIKWIYKSL